jgi:hypothetical protein
MESKKPWDILRIPAGRPPISPGMWQAIGGMRIGWQPAMGHQFGLAIEPRAKLLWASQDGGPTANTDDSYTTASCASWREVGEFLIVLADQIEGVRP